ncbi:MAG: FAD-dependent oxidoreductase [Chrysiogenetes bacterium]|nr:FAD-dependent oxidoreductase [Chrysiogenetes bacterium]
MAKKIEDIIVIGGSASGLAAALALSNQGYRVRVFEKDGGPLPTTRVEAFEDWDRKGAPQVRTSHGFIARLRNLLKNEFPGLYQELLDEGAYDTSMADLWPPTIEDTSPQPGDEEVCMLACRRITFDWVLRRHVERNPLVTVEAGCACVGLLAEDDAATGLKRVTGVRIRREDGSEEEHRADLVVDASGRRTGLDEWLEGAGAPRPRQESEHCGYFICSRFYKMRPGMEEPPDARGFNAVDLGYMAALLVRGDSGIFSIMLATPRDDAEFKQLVKPERFDAAVKAIPLFAPWIEEGRADPITDVRGFGQVMNTRRYFLDERGEPIVLGFVAVGDTAMHTNPAYGRGVTQSFLYAQLLAQAVAGSGGDLRELSLNLERRVEEELGPWYQHALKTDRQTRAARERQAKRKAEPQSTQVDPDEFMRSVMSEGVGVAMRTDPVVFRAGMRVYNMLALPKTMQGDPELMKRVMKVWQERENRAPQVNGPERDQMLEILRRAA